MSDPIRKIGISTGGGDCPGLNAVIRGATKAAILQHGWEVVGIRDGFDGLVLPDPNGLVPLTLKTVSGILPRGGTILGTTNRGNPFKYRRMVDGHEVVEDVADQVVERARREGIDAVIVIGGDGTQKIGYDLYQRGLKVVGVPKTIDNDLDATDVTFGFDTALHTAVDAVDKIHTTAESHHRIMLVEVMGRDAGWIALHAGLGGGAHVILLPEVPFTIENICQFVKAREKDGKRFTIIVVAEGVKLPADMQRAYEHEKRATPRAGAVANLLGEAIARCAHREVRVTVLGHIQRGGSPSPFDRVLSTRFGVRAVELIARRDFGCMVALRGSDVVSVPILDAIGRMKAVPPDGELVRVGKAIGVCFGD